MTDVIGKRERENFPAVLPPTEKPEPDLDALTRSRIALLRCDELFGPYATTKVAGICIDELNHLRVAAGLEPVE